MLELQIKLDGGATLPSWGDNPNRIFIANGGLDIHSNVYLAIGPGERVIVGTGMYTAFHPQYVALLRDRSGLAAKHGLTVMAGVIDSGYRGEWKIVMLNTSKVEYIIAKRERICQAIFVQPHHLRIAQVHELPSSERGEKGFGSSGK